MYQQSSLSESDRGARRGGLIATTLYVVVMALALWFTRCDTAPPLEDELTQGSILIAFGNEEAGGGEVAAQEVEPIVESPATPEPEPIVEESFTDESSEVEVPTPEADQPEEVVAPAREVNRRALFPGAKADSGESRGEGEPTPQNVAGSEQGSADATASNLGGGLSGDFDLAGRTLMGRLPVPNYSEQDEGRVVMNITVDEAGHVTSASLRAESSTTNNSRLIAAARDAALKARFSPSGSFTQIGTITYIFKLN